MSETFGLSAIGQIAITVHNVDESTAFYRDILGMKHLFSVPNMSFFSCGGIRLMLSHPDSPEFDHPPSLIYFKVDNIQEAHRILKERGVKFQGEPHLVARMPDHDLWLNDFRDNEGHLLVLMSEVPNK